MKVIPNGNLIKFELPEALESWATSAKGDKLALAARLLNDCESTGISASDSNFSIPAKLIAAWPESIAVSAGLPKNCPFGFDLRLSSGLGQSGTTISVRWLKPSTSLPLSQIPIINGLLITLGSHNFRIQDPYFSVLEHVKEFNESGLVDPQEQFRIWSHIRSTLGEENVGHVTDSFLRIFRVMSADSLTFSFSTDTNGDLQIDPVLLTSQFNIEDGTTGKVRALLESEESTLVSRLDSLADGASAFPLSNGTYVVVDERLQKALAAVKTLRKASPEERKRAILHPEAVIAEMIGENSDSQDLSPVFIETETYSERVLDVAEWVPPIVPWIKVQSQQWLPSDTYGFRIGEAEIPLTEDDLIKAIETIEEAIKKGENTAIVNGQTVPANAETIESLTMLKDAVVIRKDPALKDEKSKISKNVLIIQTNFEDSDFAHTSVLNRPGAIGLPDSLKTLPKQHQVEGLSWLQSHWLTGSRGALLADDMGLGKTFQALAFLSWIKEQMNVGLITKRPILIVAPVGLLRNWEAEHDLHLASPGLGDVVRAYGDFIKFLKKGSHKNGNAGLDSAQLSSADWVLTNYEAISDYQLTFGAIKFACVVFDEAQKIKTPSARMTHAAKGLNTEFVLAMTGTPVENRLADLWCIADVVQPSALGSIKAFSNKYEGIVSEIEIKALRDKIWQEESQIQVTSPLLMLRRLKSEKLKGLPAKYEHVISKNMPDEQAQAYSHAIALNEIRGPQGTLGTIQAMRAVSLHPDLYYGKAQDLIPEKSARFLIALDILDKCFELNEKVLIFIESLDLQSADQLPLILQQRYKLSKLPLVINGEVNTFTRQNRVDDFQSREGFDIMILSPKAGGVGITLTAANHVIHLSRWWNPAVEDQCSDRAYRIGQKKDVHIYYPMAINPLDPDSSFDLKLDELMTRKRSLSQQLLAAPTITKEDYETLLSQVKR
jgi:superfamily II DNA or RNA helicase